MYQLMYHFYILLEALTETSITELIATYINESLLHLSLYCCCIYHCFIDASTSASIGVLINASIDASIYTPTCAYIDTLFNILIDV